MDIIRRITDGDDRIKLINQSNQGVAAARNRGIEAAQGQYLCFIDSDDCVTPHFLQQLIEASTDTDGHCLDYIIGGFQYARHSRSNVGLHNETYYGAEIKHFIKRHILGNYAAVCWGKLYKRAIIAEKSISFPKGQRLAEDAVFNFRFINHCGNIRLIESGNYIYTEAAANRYDISTDDFRIILNNLEDIYKVLETKYTCSIPRSSASWLLGFRDIDTDNLQESLDNELSLYRIPYPTASIHDYMNDIKCSPVIRKLLAAKDAIKSRHFIQAADILYNIRHHYTRHLHRIHPPYTPLKLLLVLTRLQLYPLLRIIGHFQL